MAPGFVDKGGCLAATRLCSRVVNTCTPWARALPVVLFAALASCTLGCAEGRQADQAPAREPVGSSPASSPGGSAVPGAGTEAPGLPAAPADDAAGPEMPSGVQPPAPPAPGVAEPEAPSVAPAAEPAAPSAVVRAVGAQWVTTYAFLDHLADAAVRSPHVPATRPLFHKVDSERKTGSTVQNPWGGDGENRYMHVRVRKTRTDRVQHDLQDCLVLPLPAVAGFEVDVLPHSALKFSPEFVRMGTANVQVRIVAVDGGQEHELFTELMVGRSLFRNSWVEQTIPLDRFAGRSIELRFEVDKPSLGQRRWERRGKHKGVALFALPRIVTRVDPQDIAQQAAVRERVGDATNYNVVMVVFDSGRADLLPPVREERGRIPSITPNLDAFFAKGVRFSRAFSVGNQTRIGSYSMYLSAPPAAAGFWQIKWGLSDAFRRRFYDSGPQSLPRRLHAQGYLTGHMGFNGFLTGFQYLSMDMGFDFVSEFAGVPENTVRMTDGINEWLEVHKDEKFFLLVWYDPPHFPYNPPSGYVDRIHEMGVDEDLRFFDHRYLGKMLYGDDHFGRLAAKLEELGLTEKTLFVVTGDHGEAMDPRHDGFSHNVDTRITRHHGKSFYDEEIHVPLLVRLDGVLEPRDVRAQVSLMSLGPTVEELLGLPHVHPHRMGRSFATLARGGSEPDGRLIYFEGRWSYGIRADGYKYIYHDPRERLSLNRQELWQRRRDGPDEIFDVEADPEETVNLAATHPEVRRQMRARYRAWRQEMRRFRETVMPGPIARPIEPLPEDY